jgi:hypothetical protein
MDMFNDDDFIEKKEHNRKKNCKCVSNKMVKFFCVFVYEGGHVQDISDHHSLVSSSSSSPTSV